MQDMEQAIRERAYHLWAADGYRDGNADAYWLAAQREILASSLESVGRVKKTAKKPAEKAKAAPAPKTKRRAA
jgi:Protein of unknown function (DUF2934)